MRKFLKNRVKEDKGESEPSDSGKTRRPMVFRLLSLESVRRLSLTSRFGGSKDSVDGKQHSMEEPAEPPPTDPRLPFNAREVFKLEKSWKGIRRRLALTSIEMIVGLFQKYEDVKAVFKQFKSIGTEDELRDDDNLEKFAGRVMGTIDDVVQNLKNTDYILEMLDAIGRDHIRYTGVTTHMLWRIEEPFLTAVRLTLEDRYSDNMATIYRTLIKFILQNITDALSDAQALVNKQTTSVSDTQSSLSTPNVSMATAQDSSASAQDRSDTNGGLQEFQASGNSQANSQALDNLQGQGNSHAPVNSQALDNSQASGNSQAQNSSQARCCSMSLEKRDHTKSQTNLQAPNSSLSFPIKNNNNAQASGQAPRSSNAQSSPLSLEKQDTTHVLSGKSCFPATSDV